VNAQGTFGTMPQRSDIVDDQDVQTLIAAFYTQARVDPQLAHFFTQVDWAHHTPRIEAFWNMLLFGQQGFMGNPMQAHHKLHARLPMATEHFERWVGLFITSVDEHFAGPKADEAKLRARTIAQLMAHKVTAP
jgi:hemoglobin